MKSAKDLQDLQEKLKEEALKQLKEAELLLETMDHRFNSPELFTKVKSHIDWLRQIVAD